MERSRVLDGKPLTSGKKGWRAQGTRSHVFWDGKPLSSLKKGSWAQGGAKTLRKAGSKSKVQFKHRGRSLTPKNKKINKIKKDAPCWKTKNDLFQSECYK